jgi:hypothetical protein
MDGNESGQKREPQNKPFNIQDPEFLDWQKRHSQSAIYTSAVNRVIQNLPPVGGGNGGGGGGTGGGSGGGVTQPLQSFYAYANSRNPQDWNTCGQAAIASITDFHYKNPYSLPRSWDGHWDEGAIVDAIIAGGFGPDVIFGWGTTPGRISSALSSYGLNARTGCSGFLFDDWQGQWNSLLECVYHMATPTPVLVDLGLLGGPAWTCHWPIAWRMDYTSTGMLIYLANCPWAPQVSESQFLDAWACRQLPIGLNHAGVYCSN